MRLVKGTDIVLIQNKTIVLLLNSCNTNYLVCIDAKRHMAIF